jgi:hypothetical protein
MPQNDSLRKASPAFQLMIASSWLAPDSWRHIQDNAVQRACDAHPNWTEYLQLIDRHRTPASSWAVLKRTPRVQVPERVNRELQRRSDLCRLQAMLHLQRLAEVLKPLNEAGIPVMPLKGPLLSLALYGDAGLRHSKDLDLLVPQGEIRRAQECLETVGWRLGVEYFPLSPRQWEANFRHELHVGYADPRHGCELELHWRWYSSQSTEHFWARARTTELPGFSYQTMSNADLAIYLCSHGGSHQWFRAKWLGDLARLHCNGQLDWTDALAQARTMGEERSVFLCLQLLSECYDLTFPNVRDGLRPLVRTAVRALTARSEPTNWNSWTRLKKGVQKYGYNRQLWPNRSWWSWFTYRRFDFKVLRLPDNLFWLYTPLRPLLWLWQRPRIELRNRITDFRKRIRPP